MAAPHSTECGPLDCNLCGGRVSLVFGPLFLTGWPSHTQIIKRLLSLRLLDCSIHNLRDQWVIVTWCPDDWSTQDRGHEKVIVTYLSDWFTKTPGHQKVIVS